MGSTWRDAVTVGDYVYVGAQSGGNMFVVDLAPLAATSSQASGECPYRDLGCTDCGHTISAIVVVGLLVLILIVDNTKRSHKTEIRWVTTKF